jgi:hypothetical protein
MGRILLSLVGAGVAFTAMGMSAQAAPAHTVSFYMSTVYRNTLHNMGCDAGKAGMNGVVVLDFGVADYSSGEWGTKLFNGAGFRSTSAIVNAAEGFLDGYWNCSGPSPQLRLAIGTSNDTPHSAYVGTSAGEVWGNAVNTISSYIYKMGYGGQESIHGAIDAEPAWDAEYTKTRDWVNGYNARTAKTLYDYGSAETGYWTNYQLWYISWGNVDALPIPEIYYPGMVTEWYNESVYAYNNQGGQIGFIGTMTEYEDVCGGIGTSCSTTTYTPAGGFNAFQTKLNSDSRTAETMSYSTDISRSWSNY